MAISQMKLVWEESKAKGNALLLLVKLADNANDEGYAYPGTKYLMKHTKITSRETLYSNLLKLEAAGEIIIEPGTGPHNTNMYFISVGLPLDKVDQRRKVMGLPSREEVAQRLEKYNEKKEDREELEDDLPVAEDIQAEGVRNSYTETEPAGVRISDGGCTDSGQGCTDFRGECTDSVHKPSLTVTLKPSINQNNAPQKIFEQSNFDSIIALLENEVPKQWHQWYVRDWRLKGMEGDVLVIACPDNKAVEFCQARFEAVTRNMARGLVSDPMLEVRFEVG